MISKLSLVAASLGLSSQALGQNTTLTGLQGVSTSTYSNNIQIIHPLFSIFCYMQLQRVNLT